MIRKRPFDKKQKIAIVSFGLAALCLSIVLANIFTSPRGPTPPERTALIKITKQGFVPTTLIISPDTAIVWSNDDHGLHQVASNPFPKDNGWPRIKSEILNNGQTYSYSPGSSGTFRYHDDLHPVFNGEVIVK